MKTIIQWCTCLCLMTLLVSCGNTTADFLAKYADFRTVSTEDNRVGIAFDDISTMANSTFIRIRYNNINIAKIPENIDLLSERFFIADVRNPEKELPVSIDKTKVSTTNYAPSGQVTSEDTYIATTLLCPEKTNKSDLIIVGFKGIDSTECAELATPPLFFVVSFTEKNKPILISQKPLLADNFFTSEHVAGYFHSQNPKVKFKWFYLFIWSCEGRQRREWQNQCRIPL